MRIAFVDATAKPTCYPVALLKLGAWRRSLGDECSLLTNSLPAAGSVDEIWVSSTFTFDTPHTVGLVQAAMERAPVVRVGGVAPTLVPRYYARTGAVLHAGLVPEAEGFAPDYSLLPEAPAYSVTHASRGCSRSCGFCMVTRLEPEFIDRPNWRADLAPEARELRFYDNNWLAKPGGLIERDVLALRELVAEGRVTRIDFNQGLDARLMTEDLADLLAGLPIRPVRFAFDNLSEDGPYQQAVRWMAARGSKEFMTYVLYNFTDTPADFYHRLRETVLLCAELQVAVASFPMCYAPILEVDRHRAYVGRHWTPAMKRGFTAIRGNHSAHSGTITPKSKSVFLPLEEFEFWFGATPEEFIHRISYPGVSKWAARKAASLRQMRLERAGRVYS